MSGEIPNPNQQVTAPQPVDPQEITAEVIKEAAPEFIAGAAAAYTYNMSKQLTGESSPLVRKSLRQKMAAGRATGEAVWAWDESNDRIVEGGGASEDFDEFLDRRLQEEDPPQFIIDAHSWVGTNSYEVLVRDEIKVAREKYEQELASQSEKEAAVQQAAEQTRQATHEASAREAVEQARGVEVFDDVVKLGKGKTSIYTDKLRRGYTDVGDASGSADRAESIDSVANLAKQVNGRDWRQHLNEAVGFEDVTERDTREVEHTHVEKGRFGRKHEIPFTTTEVVPGSERPTLIRNELTGHDEPAVRLQYIFSVGEGAVHAGVPSYGAASGGRGGNELKIGVDLPKSVADKLKTQIEQDPGSIRTLVKKLMLENNDGTVTEESLRPGAEGQMYRLPPYDELPDDWTIALVKDTSGGLRTPLDQIQRLPVSK